MEVEERARLRLLVERSPLLPDADLRTHWLRLIPWLPAAARFELAEILQLGLRDDECRA
jgi:hypothetical protein